MMIAKISCQTLSILAAYKILMEHWPTLALNKTLSGIEAVTMAIYCRLSNKLSIWTAPSLATISSIPNRLDNALTVLTMPKTSLKKDRSWLIIKHPLQSIWIVASRELSLTSLKGQKIKSKSALRCFKLPRRLPCRPSTTTIGGRAVMRWSNRKAVAAGSIKILINLCITTPRILKWKNKITTLP